MKSTLRLLVLIAAAFSVGGCGGGDSPPSDGASSSQSNSLHLPNVDSPVAQCLGSLSTQGVEGTGFTRKIQGVLTAVGDGTATVGGILYDASHAVVLLNGVCVTLPDLQIGTTVTVEGTVNDADLTGTAYIIYSGDSVVGGIDSIDVAAGALSVNGQRILVSPTTVFGDDIEPGQLDTLQQYNMIGVSGSRHPDGTLWATRIQRWPTDAFSGVAGIVSSVDVSRHLLYVGDVRVLYDEAVLVNFQSDGIRAGDYIRALGYPIVIRVGFSGSGITAFAIQRVDTPVADPRNDIVVSGAVSLVRGSDDFDVMGQPVKVTSATQAAGIDIDLVNWGSAGLFVTVFGTLDQSGYVIARAVVGQWGAPLLMTGPITAIDALTRTVEVIGVPVRLSSNYSYLERSDTGQAIPINSLHVGDQLAVEGSPLDTGLVDVLIARQRAPSMDVDINNAGWKPGESHKPTIVLMNGVQADTSSADFFWGHTLGAGCSCRPSTADAFWNYSHFSFLGVQVRGQWTGDHIQATSVYWLDE